MREVLWFVGLAAGVVYAAATGNIDQVTVAAFAAADEAVKLVLGLCGMMCLWMGLLRIAEAAGLVDRLARLLTPLVRRLFPSVPPGHPAMGAIVMNVSANLLGLGNAATPMGLKAMEHLQALNPDKTKASPAMVTLLALNTAAVTLMPTMVISLRMAAGSQSPASITGATILSSSIGMASALVLDWILRRGRR